MKDAATLITAIAALIGALAWPTALVILVLGFRRQISDALAKVPAAIDRVENFKLGSLEAKLSAAAKPLIAVAVDEPTKISQEQLDVTEQIRKTTLSLDDRAKREQVRLLAQEYENCRADMSAGALRTRAMTTVVVKMRTFAQAMVDFLPELKVSHSAGERLAAVTIMQVVPEKIDFSWLLERFSVEQPFIFFHAAVALHHASNSTDEKQRVRAVHIASQALHKVLSFEGVPDKSTVDVLEQAMSS